MENEGKQPIGPGAIVDAGEAPKPTLDGCTDYEYVEILNPMSAPFAAQFGVTRPMDAPLTINTRGIGVSNITEQQIASTYGVTKNPDHGGKAHISNQVIIEPGKTIRVLGASAQVIVRQLVTLILQQEGKKLSLADPFQRKLVEGRIIQGRGSAAEFIGQPKTVSQQLQEGLDKKYEQEQEFGGAGSPTPEENPAPEHIFVELGNRKPGRPPKSPTSDSKTQD